MLIGQASINLSANILSALLGLLSVFIFTRLFSPHDYGIYLLGIGFASVVSTFLAGWFRNIILSGHARNDGTDVRGPGDLRIFALLPGCTRRLWVGPAGRAGWFWQRGGGRACSRDRFVRSDPGSGPRAASGFTAMRATLVRAAAALSLGVFVALFSPTGISVLLSSALACLLAVAVQCSRLARNDV